MDEGGKEVSRCTKGETTIIKGKDKEEGAGHETRKEKGKLHQEETVETRRRRTVARLGREPLKVGGR